MKGILRYIAALLAVICLLGAALLGMFCCVTTERFAREVNGTAALRIEQQARIDRAAADLSAVWQLSPDALAPWTADAAVKQSDAAAKWWGAIWADAQADSAMPPYLDSASEAALVADIRADAGFIAITDENQRRAIARDEVAYALDEAVCDAVTPLRRSIIEMALSLLSEAVPLPMIRQAALLGAGVLAAIALVLLLLAHRAAGSALTVAGLMMALLTVPVLLADVPGMLRQLNEIFMLQGQNALACMGILWCGAAAALALMGLLILGVKRLVRRNAE